MSIADLLQRFRPAGAPGAAGPVAVPAQAEERLAAELAPVFDALGPVVAECETIRAGAAAAAADTVAEARRIAASMVADAALRAPGESAAAAAGIRRSGEAAADAVVAEARATAERLHEDGRGRLADLTDVVLANLRDSIVAGTPPSGEGR